jgi:transcriptional regulator with XRE-family HTH domain
MEKKWLQKTKDGKIKTIYSSPLPNDLACNEQNELKDLGYNIKNLREEKRLSRKKLSRLIRKEEDYIRKLENGEVNISMDILILIARFLDVSLEKFFTPVNIIMFKTKFFNEEIITEATIRDPRTGKEWKSISLLT